MLTIALLVFALSIGLQAAIYVHSAAWNIRKALVLASTSLNAFSVGIIFIEKPNFITLFLVFTAIYMSISSARLVQDRLQTDYLKSATIKSFVFIALVQIVLFGAGYWHGVVSLLAAPWIIMIYLLLTIAVAAILLANGMAVIKKATVGAMSQIDNHSLPTVTLAIPARNEDAALERCLDAAIASDYPKLEIIVIDDCSQDNTPAIIKQYAHSGVRFFQTDKAGPSWLDKNNAYQTLFQQANGQIIMFMSVDVVLSPNSIKQLINLFVGKNKAMMSVVAELKDENELSNILQPLVYWREILLPSIAKNRPPVFSMSWLINKKVLENLGGFSGFKRSITPEAHLAQQLADKYMFIKNNPQLGIVCYANPDGQWDRAIRLGYPQVHRRPELVMLFSAAKILFLFGPFAAMLVLVLSSANILNVVLSIASVGILTASNVIYHYTLTNKIQLTPFFSLPINVLVDIASANASMYLYEFRDVVWRGRSVAGPVMHTYPHLPNTD